MTTKTIKRLSITVPAVPVAQPRQRHRIVKGKGGRVFASNYTPARDPVNAFKATCQMAAESVYKGAPLDGPLIVDFVFVMPRPRAKVWKTKPMPRYPHTGTPDRDNLIKSVQDALNGLVWADDAQIFDGRIEKWVASGDEQSHVEIVVREYGGVEA